MDRLTGIAIFVRVVETESFSRAADQLGLSKSTVSKQIRRLEDRLGVRLLNRTTRSMSLTDVGREFYERCSGIVDQAQAAEAAVTDMQTAPVGKLRVAGPMSFGTRELAPAISEFLREHEGMHVELSLSDHLVNLVDEGFDLAIRVSTLPDSSLVATRLAPARRVVVASPAYLAKAGTPAHPSDLADHQCLLYAYQRGSAETWRFEGEEGQEVAVRVSGMLRVNNGEALARAAREGLGVVMLPTFIVGDDLRAGNLECLFPDWKTDMGGVYAIYPHGRHLSPRLRAFVDFLRARFGPHPAWDEGVVDPPTNPRRANKKASRAR